MNGRELVKSAPARSRAMPVLEQERRILEVGEANGWPFQVRGVAPPPLRPMYFRNWYLVPIEQDDSVVPARALVRMAAIYEAGVTPKALIIAHELPPLLPAPPEPPRVVRSEVPTKQLSESSRAGIKGAVAPANGLLSIGAAMARAMAFLPLLALPALAALVDPCLFVVTEDDVWIQIDFWYDKE